MNENIFQTDSAAAKRNFAAGAVQEKTQEIDLLLLFNVLRRRILIIIAVALVFALGAGIIVQFFITPLYEATTSVYLVSANDSLLSMSDLQISSDIAPDYVDIIKSRTMLEHVINDMNLEYEYEVLKGKVTVVNPANTHIIKITITDPSPTLARDIANNLASYAVERISLIMDISVPYIYDVAIAADYPYYPSLTKTVVTAFLLGTVLVCGVIIFITIMDTTVKTAEDIEQRCGMVTLTKVYYEDGKKRSYGYNYGYGAKSKEELERKNRENNHPELVNQSKDRKNMKNRGEQK